MVSIQVFKLLIFTNYNIPIGAIFSEQNIRFIYWQYRPYDIILQRSRHLVHAIPTHLISMNTMLRGQNFYYRKTIITIHIYLSNYLIENPVFTTSHYTYTISPNP